MRGSQILMSRAIGTVLIKDRIFLTLLVKRKPHLARPVRQEFADSLWTLSII
jgi:hypothetical protein